MSKLTKILLVFIAVAALTFTFSIGYRLGTKPVLSGSAAGLQDVDKAWNIIFNEYVDKSKLDPEKLSQGAIEGMIKALDDPYMSYLSPGDYQMFLSSLHGQFEGIGAHVGMKDDKVTIIAPIAGSPAEKAGIKPGDAILAIDGVTAVGLNLNEAVLKIRGPKGTTVKIRVQHVGEMAPVDIDIVRDTIKVSSVYSEMKGDLVYIVISQFEEQTDAQLVTVLKGLSSQNTKGIIIDLRRNPGGLLDSVVNIASHFIKEGPVVKVRSNQDQITIHDVRKTDVFTELPMVVLVDQYSASGSEVLSGALQDYKRATIAGVTTYGKGSVNMLRQLDGSGIYVTIARWLTPNDRAIEGKGIVPDIVLDPKIDQIQWAIDYLHGQNK